jgi:hypothetical protein
MQCDRSVTPCHAPIAVIVTGTVEGVERWAIRDRLNRLEIACDCQMGEPLQVQMTTPLAVLQFWSVMQCYRQPRSVLVDRLEHCWRLR